MQGAPAPKNPAEAKPDLTISLQKSDWQCVLGRYYGLFQCALSLPGNFDPAPLRQGHFSEGICLGNMVHLPWKSK
jgi:hypothetical protein